MKTKFQKRIEAVERLERPPPFRNVLPNHEQEVYGKRLAEAARLRRKFGMASRDEAA